jgi:hypothetical protein
MNDTLDKLPSVRQMFKLIAILLLALIAISIAVAIVKALMPLLFVAVIIVGGWYLYTRTQTKAKRA